MMVTDQGRLIRVPVGDVRIAGRNTQGVTLFKVGDKEQIVSVERVEDSEDEEEQDETNANLETEAAEEVVVISEIDTTEE